MNALLPSFKIHLNIAEDDDSLSDALLSQCLDVAQATVEGIMNCAIQPMPETVAHAIRLLAAHGLENREAAVAGVSLTTIPFGVKSLLSPYRYWPGQDLPDYHRCS